MLYALSLMIGLALWLQLMRRLRRDRLATVLAVVVYGVFLNAIAVNFPTDMHHFGHGFPWTWNYDPGYVHTGRSVDQRPVTPYADWQFNEQALLWDFGVWLGVLVVCLLANEVWQHSHGNRPQRYPAVMPVDRC